jgi:hypothetical protein
MTTEERINAGHIYAVDELTGKTIFMADVIAEAKLGRKLTQWEEVRHKNGDPLDNRRENLEIINRAVFVG